MDLDGLRVDHAGLEQTADDLLAAVHRIRDRLARLEAELEPLRSRWAGDAQRAYLVAKSRWDGAIDEMQALLADTAHAVREADADYRAADRRAARMFEP